jgi:fatty-acyl-CoA synthase
MTPRKRGPLSQLAGIARPTSLAVLRRAGVVDPAGIVGLAASIPWMLGRGPSLGILSQGNAVSVGHKPALHDRWGTLTWREVDARSNRLARAMSARGVRPGDTVATVLRNGREIVETLLAAQKLGAVTCPMNTWAGRAELRSALESARPKLLVYDLAHQDQVDASAPPGILRVAAGEVDARHGLVAYEDLLRRHPALPLPPLGSGRRTPTIVVHTSGTTGRPKGARRGAGMSAEALVRMLDVVPFHRRDVILCPAPLFHSFGLFVLALGMLVGATYVLPFGFDAEDSLELMERHEATAITLVPVMLRRLLALPEDDVRRVSASVRLVLSGGAALPPELRELALRRLGPVTYDLYGSTEAGWVAVATPEDMAERPDTVGHPVPGVNILIADETGHPVPVGTVGEIRVRSDAAFDGYTTGEASPVADGFVTTGDLGRVDEDGRLYVEGRVDDMVVVGGENVYPAEVENVIRTVDGVLDVAVAGTPDPEYGRALIAFVVGDADDDRILGACRSSLARYKVPRRIERVPDLPRTATGKVRLRELQKE